MLQQWQYILIAFLTILGAIVAVLFCAHWGGWTGLSYYSGRWLTSSGRRFPRSIQQALTELEGVTEKTIRRNPQTESEQSECPICLGPLYPREGHASTIVEADKVDVEAGQGVAATCTTTEVTTVESKNQPVQPINDDILKMKRCTHLFHARCLAMWFLRKKYNCPVCRTPYYQVVDDGNSMENSSAPPPLPVVAFW
ncbi:uncharacterized protein GGS22DRAFT_167918 [Annulohypoxylon maeteangense]|uniref:uncharacterized protein n=1 Tax=Annulohypoxylon maeteangense TaxID=1927788 RepID=UPI002007261F|nr:uncharacterized protein GGS22DRAFT_167918 [Annulohypoxylon maeteangense]KAI0883120.1 hypothetical protein GGS22DRAFT_167918 [Annulohypoxylon maeteangense]